MISAVDPVTNDSSQYQRSFGESFALSAVVHEGPGGVRDVAELLLASDLYSLPEDGGSTPVNS
jgi:hypothetical protein